GDLLDRQAARRRRPENICLHRRRVEPAGAFLRREHDDRAVVIRRDVGAGLAGQHREGLAHLRVVAPEAGDREPRRAVQREEPLVLAFRLGIAVRGELVEPAGQDQASAAAELPALRTEVVDRPAARTWPGSAAVTTPERY